MKFTRWAILIFSLVSCVVLCYFVLDTKSSNINIEKNNKDIYKLIKNLGNIENNKNVYDKVIENLENAKELERMLDMIIKSKKEYQKAESALKEAMNIEMQLNKKIKEYLEIH